MADDQTVNDDLDIMFALFIEGRDVIKIDHLTINAGPLEASGMECHQVFTVFTFTAADNRRHQIEAGAIFKPDQRIDHLADSLAADRQACRRRVGDAHPCPQQTHIIIDFSDRTDSRTRIARCCFLLDGNGRGKALDQIDIRLLHHLQKLPGISGERFDIAALAFGVNRIKGKGGFARSGQPRQDNERIPWDIDGNVFQVMFPRAADMNIAACFRRRDDGL